MRISSSPYIIFLIGRAIAGPGLKRCFLNYCRFLVVASRLLRLVADGALRSRYRQQLLRVLRARWREPHILFIYALKIATHYHYAAITRALVQVEGKREVTQCGAFLLAGEAPGRPGSRLGELKSLGILQPAFTLSSPTHCLDLLRGGTKSPHGAPVALGAWNLAGQCYFPRYDAAP